MTIMKIVWEIPAITFCDITIALVVFAVVLAIIKDRRSTGNGAACIPGPRSWPIIGNLLQLGEYPYLTLAKMREEYGDVLCIKLGMVPVVVVSGIDTIKQALIKQGNSFAGRPDFYTFSLIGNGNTMTFSEKYGESWKLHKKIAKNALRDFSLTEAQSSTCSCLLEEHVCAEAAELVKVLLNKAEKGSAFDPVEPITSAVANVICALCFGKRYDHNDREFLTIVQTNYEVLRTLASGNVADVFPFLRYLPNPSIKSLVKFVNRINNFMIKSIQEHYTTYDKNCIQDITDSLIALSQNRKVQWNNANLTDEQIVSTVSDIFGGGFDTIITGLQWCMLYLIQYPEFQTRIQQEIDEKVGQSRLPRFEDRTLMPFTEAFINEVFRHTTYVPFTIPHCTTDNTMLNGYFIPKDTCVFINQYQVNHDETLWENAESFNPQRFLDEKGELNKNVTEKVMMFGLGRRRCLGENIARIEMFTFLTTLLHQLKIQNPPDQKLDLTPNYGLTMKPKFYKIIVSLRR